MIKLKTCATPTQEAQDHFGKASTFDAVSVLKRDTFKFVLREWLDDGSGENDIHAEAWSACRKLAYNMALAARNTSSSSLFRNAIDSI